MRLVASVLGVLLALLTILRVLDIGFFESLDRAFNPLVDWRYAGSAIWLLHHSVGYRTATLIQLGIVAARRRAAGARCRSHCCGWPGSSHGIAPRHSAGWSPSRWSGRCSPRST